MKTRELAVEGAFEFTPTFHPDDRGRFLSPYQENAFVEALGHPIFRVAQTNHSVSRRGVVRGVHYTATPPGSAKYVYCARGRALDYVVDLRIGSPTFGRWDVVTMDQDDHRATYFPVGVGHAFVALEDDTVMSYMLSGSYVPENELALSVFDQDLRLELPEDLEPVLSQRDRAAITLAEARAEGLLPDYDRCRRLERETVPLAG
ncbi:dTDP-4-dehydrorhamnose 3,5-epimerase family protein [Lentzea sp. NPDC034063]|uniref:dTDP-4-dehydrorhamnose 3,5-epimerase family protein n=1 Tax=unclassified Lentzea TaxID=2643253 RepID=UPI0033C69402